MTEPGPELLTATQAASRAGVSERTMRKWIASSKVGTHDTPEGRRVDRASLDAYRVERAAKAGNGAGPRSDLATVPGPELGAELLTEVRALRREVAELRAALLPGPEPEPETAPPPGWWARLREWWRTA